MKGLILWSVSLLVGGTLSGFAWLATDVTIPLWGLLVLTFVPTREMTQAIRARVNPQAKQNNTSSTE